VVWTAAGPTLTLTSMAGVSVCVCSLRDSSDSSDWCDWSDSGRSCAVVTIRAKETRARNPHSKTPASNFGSLSASNRCQRITLRPHQSCMTAIRCMNEYIGQLSGCVCVCVRRASAIHESSTDSTQTPTVKENSPHKSVLGWVGQLK
jgi:hypothetical protein